MKELIGEYIITFPVGPIVSNSDGLTPVTDLTLSGADEKAIRKHGTLTPVSISANSWGAIESMDGHYNLTLTNSQMDTYGVARISIQDDSKCLPYFEDVGVVTSGFWNSKYNTNDWALASALPNSETLNAHIITLATSEALNAHMVTLPNSEVINTHFGTLPVSGYVPSSGMVADLPNSLTVKAWIDTLPNSLTLNAHIITLPTSEVVGTIAGTALSNINLDHLMKTVVADSSDLTNEVVDYSVLGLMIAAGGDVSAFVSSDDSLQGISEGVAGGGASASEVQSACFDSFNGILPNSQTLNAHIITLPTSEVLNAHIVTLPLSGSLPSSGTLKDLINTLPNSQVLNAHMITLPTSLTLKAHVDTLPTSETLNTHDAALATLIGTLPTSLTLQAHIVTLPTSQTLNAHAITLPTSQTVMNAISSMDVRVSSLFYTEIESGYPFLEKQRIDMAVLAGITSGGGSATLHFRDVGDTKSRLIVTVDSDGNRTAVNTLDGS